MAMGSHEKMKRTAIRWFTLFFLLLFAGGTAWTEDFENEDCMLCHGDRDEMSEERPGLFVESASYEASIHADLLCSDCHEGIDDLPHEDELPAVDCGSCHDEIPEVYQASVHGLSPHEGATAEAATCVSCHGIHDMFSAEDPRSTVHHHNLAHTCIQCHEDAALIEKHELPSGETIQSYVYSVHGHSNIEDPGSKAATCSDCHGWHDTQSHESPDSKVSRQNVAETCGQCHEDVLEVYYGGVHGDLAKQGNPDVPVCTDCHGEHRIRSPQDRESTVSKFRISETCARCHEDPEIVKKYDIPIASPSLFYRDSVHGKALLEDRNEEAAACQDCHGHHSILKGQNPESSVNKWNVSKTCGQCHPTIQEEYDGTIHGTALQRGVREAPSCTDCHGEHTIRSHSDPESPVHALRLAKEVCGRCHGSLVLNRKYGLSTGKVETFLESYHGLASRLGDENSANCASCHGVHDILPSSDPQSSIHPNNLQKTCGGCHPGATQSFVSGLIHVSPKDSEHTLLYLVRIIYMVLIVVTIGGMLAHNFIIMFRHVRDKYRHQKAVPHIQRFPKVAIIQHLLLTVTFILLVITGFSLSFPDSLFSRAIGEYFLLGEKHRSLVHRISGVGLALTFLWHIIGLVASKRGRMELRALSPGIKDLKDAVQNVLYHLGLARTRPKFDRYDYSEKMEYWALIWGTLIMIATGLLMWFPAGFSRFLGLEKIWFDIANVIHYYEAWLATLAIVVWHFFFVIFHPEEYPMSLSWLTGKLSVESMEERHPLELERLVEEGKVEAPEKPKEGSEE